MSIINSVCIFGIVLSQLLGFPEIIASTYEHSVPVFILNRAQCASIYINSFNPNSHAVKYLLLSSFFSDKETRAQGI